MTLKSAGRLFLCVMFCIGVGSVGSIFTRPEIPTWYAGLNKPSWTPPPFLFPIAWTILYALMATTLWRLWDRAKASSARTKALVWFFVQLAFNAAWSPVFFGLHATRAALVIIGLMIVTISMTIVTTARIDRFAAWLLAPYLLWVIYAATINAGVVALN